MKEWNKIERTSAWRSISYTVDNRKSWQSKFQYSKQQEVCACVRVRACACVSCFALSSFVLPCYLLSLVLGLHLSVLVLCCSFLSCLGLVWSSLSFLVLSCLVYSCFVFSSWLSLILSGLSFLALSCLFLSLPVSFWLVFSCSFFLWCFLFYLNLSCLVLSFQYLKTKKKNKEKENGKTKLALIPFDYRTVPYWVLQITHDRWLLIFTEKKLDISANKHLLILFQAVTSAFRESRSNPLPYSFYYGSKFQGTDGPKGEQGESGINGRTVSMTCNA